MDDIIRITRIDVIKINKSSMLLLINLIIFIKSVNTRQQLVRLNISWLFLKRARIISYDNKLHIINEMSSWELLQICTTILNVYYIIFFREFYCYNIQSILPESFLTNFSFAYINQSIELWISQKEKTIFVLCECEIIHRKRKYLHNNYL